MSFTFAAQDNKSGLSYDFTCVLMFVYVLVTTVGKEFFIILLYFAISTLVYLSLMGINDGNCDCDGVLIRIL